MLCVRQLLLYCDADAHQIQVRGKGSAPPSKGKQADCADGPQAVGEAEGDKEQCTAAQDSESASRGSERFVRFRPQGLSLIHI